MANSLEIPCPHCGKPINPGELMGKLSRKKKPTQAQSIASAENGKKGGRPKKVIIEK